MTGGEMERAIEFLVNHHAKVSPDIEGLKEAQVTIAANIASLAAQAEVDRREMRETIHIPTEEMPDGFRKFISSNEITRDLANQVARLATETSRRVTVLEDRVR